MNKTLKRLAAAVAATSALTFIPLAAVAGPTAASPGAGPSAGPQPGAPPRNLTSSTWAGRYTQSPNGVPVYAAAAWWTAPKLDPAHSTGPVAPYRVAMWAGIGGEPRVDGDSARSPLGLEQVGIAATATSKHDKHPVYVGFWQTDPKGGIRTDGWLTGTLGKAGKPFRGSVAIHAGDAINASVYAPHDGYFDVAGRYTMILSVNGKVYWTFQQAHGRPGTTAEVITERLGDDGLLGTGTVRYSEAYIYTDPKFGAIGPQPLGRYTETMVRHSAGQLVSLETAGPETPVPNSKGADQFSTTFTGKWDAPPQVVLIQVRGTRNGNGQDTGPTDGVVSAFASKVHDRLGAQVVATVPVSYPAIAFPSSLRTAGNFVNHGYADSEQQGVSSLENLIWQQEVKHPHAWIAFVGYSSGAQVVRTALAGMLPAQQQRVAFIVTYGDPLFLPYKSFDKGGWDGTLRGIYYSARNLDLSLPAPHADVPKAMAGRMQDWCQAGDPVANFSLANLITWQQHFAYAPGNPPKPGPYIIQGADFAARTLNSLPPR
jgi:hypothetical protein